MAGIPINASQTQKNQSPFGHKLQQKTKQKKNKKKFLKLFKHLMALTHILLAKEMKKKNKKTLQKNSM